MNNKGMTLIEVILAIMIIGVIAIAFLPSISSGYNMLTGTKKFTIDSFEAQKEIELLMEKARKKEDINAYPQIEENSIKVFGKDVKGYKVSMDISNHGKINAFVGDIRPPEPKVPVADKVNLKGMKNNKEIKYIYGADKDIYLEGSYEITGDTRQYLLNVIQKWYVSEEGFYPIIPEAYPEIDAGNKYPVFPNNYELINGESTKKLTNLEKYLGRHIIYTVTPISKIGKYGVEVNSNPLYVIGLPFIDGLSLHLDSSYIDSNNGDFQSWTDLSGTHDLAKPDKPNKTPNIIDGVLYMNGSALKIQENNSLDSENLTIFTVVKNTESGINRIQNIISKYNNSNEQGWQLRLNSENVEFEYMGLEQYWNWGWRYRKKSNTLVRENYGEDKHIIMASFSPNNTLLGIDGSDFLIQNKNYTNSINNEPIIIGGDSSYVQISEILIFKKSLSEEERKQVETYLSIKHNLGLNNNN